jgi:hypothetical protein
VTVDFSKSTRTRVIGQTLSPVRSDRWGTLKYWTLEVLIFMSYAKIANEPSADCSAWYSESIRNIKDEFRYAGAEKEQKICNVILDLVIQQFVEKGFCANIELGFSDEGPRYSCAH